MDKHPLSAWTQGGIPASDVGVPAPADLESWGASWTAATDDYLVGLAARQYGTAATANAMPALIESQRRLRRAIEAFDATASAQSEKLIALTNKLVVLTRWIIGLTVVLGVLAALQLWVALR